MGLQSDGTAIVGDRLALSYGVTFGTPTAITWYKDGSVIKTWGNGNGNLNQDGGLYKDVDASDGAGTYTATVVAEGITYATNEIVVTTAEEAAEIIGFEIEDDYSDGTDIVYDTKDDKAVATVTLKKNYDGKIAIYKANDNKFKGAIDTVKTSTAVAEKATKYYVAAAEGGENNAIAGNSVLTTDQATNFQILNLRTAGAAVGHINADGSATYKFQVDGGVFTRGQDYVVVFDQASVVTDTPGTGIANVFDEEVTVPYVETPAAIAVTKVSAGNYPEISFVDEDGNTLAWFGETTHNLSTSGIDKGEIYYATSKLNDPEKGTKQGVAINTAGNVEKGVWKSNVKAAAIIDAYWFASVTTKKGIFDKDAVTLTSEAVPVAQKSADTINLVEDSTTATSATVKFTNLRANGTVYIVRGLKERTDAGKTANTWDGTDYYSTTANVFKAYEAGINEAIVGKEDVEAGAASVTVAQTISEYETKAEADADTALGDDTAGYFPVNNYIAVFVPDDEDNYGMIYTTDGFLNKATKEDSTSSADSQGLSLTQVATSIKFDKTAGTVTKKNGAHEYSITSPGLKAYDQFGKLMNTDVASTEVTSVEQSVNKGLTTDERGTATYIVNGANGQVTVVLKTADIIDLGDGLKITVLGSTIDVNAKYLATAQAGAVSNGLVVKVGSDTLYEDANFKELAAAKVVVNASTATPRLDSVTITTTATITSVEGDDTSVAQTTTVDGYTYTTAWKANGDGTVTIVLTKGAQTRTITYAATASGGDSVTIGAVATDVYIN